MAADSRVLEVDDAGRLRRVLSYGYPSSCVPPDAKELRFGYVMRYGVFEHDGPLGCGGIVYAGPYNLDGILRAVEYHESVCPKLERHESPGHRTRSVMGTAIAASVLNQNP